MIKANTILVFLLSLASVSTLLCDANTSSQSPTPHIHDECFYNDKEHTNYNSHLKRMMGQAYKKGILSYTIKDLCILFSNHIYDLISNNKTYFYEKNPQHNFHQKSKSHISITPVGHATCLIQYNNINIITDPIFWDIPFFCKRMAPPVPQPENLPKIDIILLSHNHRDHCDIKNLQFIYKHNPECKVIVPTGMKKDIIEIGFNYISEYTWWEGAQVSKELMITCLPAQHWCQRGLGDYNKSLWGGWMISIKNKNIYFAGDTGYNENIFKNIKNHFGKVDAALLPIMPADPTTIMKYNHMSPEDAVQAFIDLELPIFIPIHWGVFNLGTDATADQIAYLKKRMNQLDYNNYLAEPTIGKITHIPI